MVQITYDQSADLLIYSKKSIDNTRGDDGEEGGGEHSVNKEVFTFEGNGLTGEEELVHVEAPAVLSP